VQTSTTTSCALDKLIIPPFNESVSKSQQTKKKKHKERKFTRNILWENVTLKNEEFFIEIIDPLIILIENKPAVEADEVMLVIFELTNVRKEAPCESRKIDPESLHEH
jgi:hypothetical protein